MVAPIQHSNTIPVITEKKEDTKTAEAPAPVPATEEVKAPPPANPAPLSPNHWRNQFHKLLTPKRLGLLIGDSYLLGMKDAEGVALDGNCPQDSCLFLKTALNFFMQQFPLLVPLYNDKQRLIKFLGILDQVKNHCDAMDKLFEECDTPQKLQQALIKYTMVLAKQVELSKGTMLAVPLGWTANAGTGHFMLGLIYLKDNVYQLIVINTGAGGLYHRHESDGAKKYLDAPRIYNIPKELATSPLFWMQLREPDILPKYEKETLRGYDENDLYLFLEPFANPNRFEKATVEFQLSGTCSLKALLVVGLIFLGAPKFKLLKHLLEASAFELLLNQPTVSPQHLIHLKKGLPNLFRQVEKFKDSPEKLLQESFHGLLYRLQRLQELLNKHVEAPTSVLPPILKPKDCPITPFDWQKECASQLNDIDCPALEQMMNAASAPYEKARELPTLPPWLLDGKAIDATTLLHSAEAFAQKGIPETGYYQEYRLEFLLQLGRLFFHSEYRQQKEQIFRELRVNRATCEKLISHLESILSKFSVHTGIPQQMVGVFSGFLAAYEIACLLEDHLGFSGEERLDFYTLDMSQFLHYMRDGQELPPSLNYQTEIDASILMQAIAKKQAGPTLFDFKAMFFDFGDEETSDQYDDPVLLKFVPELGDYRYSSVHALKLKEEIWDTADKEYEVEQRSTHYQLSIDKRYWRTAWWYLHMAHPHFQQLRHMAVIARSSCGLWNDEGKSDRIGKNKLSMDEQENVLIFETELKFAEKEAAQKTEEEYAQMDMQLSSSQEGKQPSWRSLTLFPDNTKKDLFLKSQRQNVNILLALPRFKELMSVHAVKGGLQISTLIHLFDKSLELFADEDARIFFWSTLFQRGELRKTLLQHPEIAWQLVKLFEKALGHYTFKATHLIEETRRLETLVYLQEQYVRCLVWMVGTATYPQAEANLRLQREALRAHLQRSDFKNLDSLYYYLHSVLLDSYQLQKTLCLEEAEEITWCRFTLDAMVQKVTMRSHNSFSAYFQKEATYQIGHIHQIRDLFSKKIPHSLFVKILRFQGIHCAEKAEWKAHTPFCWIYEEGNIPYTVDLLTSQIYRRDVSVQTSNLFKTLATFRDTINFHIGHMDNRYRAVTSGTMTEHYYEDKDRIGRIRFASNNFQISIFREYLGRWYICTGDDHPSTTPMKFPHRQYPFDWSSYTLWMTLAKTGEALLISLEEQRIVYRIDKEGLFWPTDSSTGYRLWKLPKSDFCPRILLWQSQDQQELQLEFHRYTCEEHPLKFERRGDERWVWMHADHTFISPHQELHGIRGFNRFLILETDKGVKEVLIPYVYGYAKISEKPETIRCLKMRLHNGLKPQSNCIHNLFLAHLLFQYAESPSDYLRVKDFLMATRLFRRFTDEELTLFIWILDVQKEKQDNDPHAYAIAMLALWLVKDNFNRYPETRSFVETQQVDVSERANLPGPDDNLERILRFWDKFTKEGLRERHMIPLAEEYLKRRLNVHHALRIENLITREQMIDWGFIVDHIYSNQQGQSITPQHIVSGMSSVSKTFEELEKLAPIEDFPPYLSRYTKDLPRHFHYLVKLLQTSNLEKSLTLRLELLMSSLIRDIHESRLAHFANPNSGLGLILVCIWLSDAKRNKEATWRKQCQIVANAYHAYALNRSEKRLAELDFSCRRYFDLVRIPKYGDSMKTFGFTKPKANQFPLLRPHELPAQRQEPDLRYVARSHERPVAETLVIEEVNCFSSFKHSDPLLQASLVALEQDYQLGRAKNLAQIQKKAPSVVEEKALSTEELKKEIVEAANAELLRDPTTRLQIGGGKLDLLDIDDCIWLFLHRDSKEIAKRTGILDPARIVHFFNCVGMYLEASVYKPHTAHYAAYSQHVEALLVFEYYKGVILRLPQVEKLEAMLRQVDGRYVDVIVQALQGEGKSFAWGPLLTLIKADGYHLSCMVYPTHLFPTALEEMNRESMRLFKQRTHALIFSDKAEHFTKPYLKNTRDMLREAIFERDCVLTTVETIRSLRTKYIKMSLVLQNNQLGKQKELEENLALLEEIMSLLRTRGLFTFDEIHEALDPRKELNMPYGLVTHIDAGYSKVVGALIRFALKVKDPNSVHPLLKLLQNQQDSLTPAQWLYLRQEIAQRLVEDPEMKALLALPEDCSEIKKYFTQSTATLPVAYQELKQKHLSTPCAADYMVLVHQMLAEKWLSDALSKGVFEHHGLNYERGAPAISIPFIANMKPAKGSEFSDSFVMMVNTYIAYVVAGIHESQIKGFILHLRQVISEEYLALLATNPKALVANSPTLIAFHHFLEQHGCHCDLMQCDLNHRELLSKIQKILNQKSDYALQLILDYANRQAIQLFDLYTSVVSSSGQDTLTAALGVTGYSATLEHPFMAPHMDYRKGPVDLLLEPGTNGQTIDLLIRKNPHVTIVGDRPEGLFRDLLQPLPESDKKCVHAVIDIGCYFRGMLNHEVAELLCDRLPKINPQLKGILFFDDTSNKLLCMHVATKSFHEMGSLDIEEICLETKYRQEELFTYYDQDHITGTHIVQLPDAIAVATFSDQTLRHQLLQGDRRMRLLEYFQRILTAVPRSSLPKLHERLGKKEGPFGILDVVLSSHFKTEEMSYRLNFLFCLQKMSNILQQYLLDKRYANKLDRKTVFGDCKELFARDIAVNLYRQYAQGKMEIDRKDYLNWVKEQLLNPLRPIQLPQGDFALLEKQLISIIASAVQHGIQQKIEVPNGWKSASIAQTLPQNAEGTMVQLRQQDHNKQQDHEKDNENQTLALWMSLSEKNAAPVIPLTEEEFFAPQFTASKILNLSSISPIFDERLLVTRNFASTCVDQINLFDPFRKPVHHFLLIQDEKTNAWQALLGSMEDGAFFCQCLSKKKPFQRKMWLLTTQLELAWSSPNPYNRSSLLSDSQAASLIGEVLFFSGDLQILTQPFALDFLKAWLKPKSPSERFAAKAFFETRILLSRLPQDYTLSPLPHLFSA